MIDSVREFVLKNSSLDEDARKVKTTKAFQRALENASRGYVTQTIDLLSISHNVSEAALALTLGIAFKNRSRKQDYLSNCYRRTGLFGLSIKALMDAQMSEDTSETFFDIARQHKKELDKKYNL